MQLSANVDQFDGLVHQDYTILMQETRHSMFDGVQTFSFEHLRSPAIWCLKKHKNSNVAKLYWNKKNIYQTNKEQKKTN